MIITKSIKPEYTLYYIGAEILKSFKKIALTECNIFCLYEATKKNKNNFSFNQYLLAIDWLYILGGVELTDEGKLKLCS